MNFISIIIVNYNGAQHLRDCLLSLEKLDYPADKFEVLVFDNGSIDDSLRVIKETRFSTRIIANPKNLGFAAPHRIAAEQSKGDVLAFLNNDMKVDSQWIKEGVALLDKAQGIACSSSKVLTWDGKHTDFHGGSLQYLGYADQIKDVQITKGDNILFPCGGAMFIQKEVFLEAGCFDDDYFAIFEDVDLGWRLWIMGYRVVMAPDSIAYHKGHGTLDTKKEEKKRFLMHRNALMTVIKNYDDENIKKILPLAFVLAIKRALLFAGIDKTQFYFWEDRSFEGTATNNPLETFLHLAALDDVFGSFKKLQEKRKYVQDKRMRSDKDILELFRDPFRNIMGYKEYLWSEVELFGDFNLEALFNCKAIYRSRVDDGIYNARQTLKDLLSEAGSKMHELQKPIAPVLNSGNITKKFYAHLREQGFTPTVKKVWSYCLKKYGKSV